MEASEDSLSFAFDSISGQRIIRKKAEFVLISADLYNFAFGDVNEEDEIDDFVVSNNKDMDKVFATLIQILITFLKTHKGKGVYFKGSTPSRTRMYQIILNKERANWEGLLAVYGSYNGNLMPFETDHRYNSFIVELKN